MEILIAIACIAVILRFAGELLAFAFVLLIAAVGALIFGGVLGGLWWLVVTLTSA